MTYHSLILDARERLFQAGQVITHFQHFPLLSFLFLTCTIYSSKESLS